MKAHRVSLKLYAEPGTLSDPERVVPVFHAWIRDHTLPELLVDVARYGHVHQGPAVLLVGREADYAIHQSEGRIGLVVTLREHGASDEERLASLFARAFRAAELLEAALEPVRFRSDELVLSVVDRLRASNDADTLEALGPEIRSAAERVLGPVTLEREGDAGEPFLVRLRRSKNERIAEIVARASARD
jgi:hypothetical protein